MARYHKASKKEWKGMGDWLGNQPLPFEEAKKFVRELNLKSEHEWRKYYRSGQKPYNIPSSPHDVYKKEWK